MKKFTPQISKYLGLDVEYFVKNGTLAFTSQFVNYASLAVLAVFMSRYLSKETYGQYSFLLSIFSALAIFALPGLNTAIYQYSSQKKAGLFLKALKMKLLYSLGGALVLLGFGAYYYFNVSRELALGFFYLASFFPLYFSLTIWKSRLEGKKDFFNSFKYSSLITFFSTAAIVLMLIYNKANVTTLLFTNLSITVFFNLLFLLLVRKDAEKDEKDKKMLEYGVFLTKISLLGIISVYADKWILGFLVTHAEYAVYAIALIIPETLGGLLKSVLNISTPKFVEYKYKDALNKILSKFWLLAIAMIVFIVAAILLTPYVVEIVFTSKYEDSILISQIILVSLFFYFFEWLFHNLLTVFEKKEAIKTITIYVPIIKIIITLSSYFLFGFFGVVLSHIVTRLLSSNVYLYFAIKERNHENLKVN